MKSLFIDTHDSEIVIGLFNDDSLIDERRKVSSRNHSDFTMPMIDDILKSNKLTVHDLKQILVVNGPGSFTGVRLGVTIAKTLAYTLNVPIKTITSLEAYAVSYESNDKKLVAIHDVKGVFGALFANDDKLLSELFYKSNDDFKKYISDEKLEDNIIPCKLDLSKIKKYMNNIEPTLAHKVNPIYIKVIEALKND